MMPGGTRFRIDTSMLVPTTQIAIPTGAQSYAYVVSWSRAGWNDPAGLTDFLLVTGHRYQCAADGSGPVRIGAPVPILPSQNPRASADPDVAPLAAALAGFDAQIRSFVVGIGKAPPGSWTFRLVRYPVFSPSGVKVGLSIFVQSYLLNVKNTAQTILAATPAGKESAAYLTQDLLADNSPAAAGLAGLGSAIDALLQAYVIAKAL